MTSFAIGSGGGSGGTVSTPLGIWWPHGRNLTYSANPSGTVDASGEIVAFIGRLYIDGRATNKTINTTGSSKFTFSLGTSPVFDNAGSEFRVGIQGVDTTTGIPARPNGVWSVYSAITLASDSTPTLTTQAAYHEKAPTSGSGTFSHGDLIAVVFEFTTRAGVDSISISGSIDSYGVSSMPGAVTNASGSWAAVSSVVPTILITFADGTIGTLDGGVLIPTSGATAITWNSTNTPDEYGNVIQVPYDCKIDAIFAPVRTSDANSDLTVNLYSSPSSPSLITSFTVPAEGLPLSINTERGGMFTLSTPISLSANTDYVITVKATGAGNVRFTRTILPTAQSRVLQLLGGTTIRGCSRKTGAFTESTTEIYPVAVRICEITIGSGGSSPSSYNEIVV